MEVLLLLPLVTLVTLVTLVRLVLPPPSPPPLSIRRANSSHFSLTRLSPFSSVHSQDDDLTFDFESQLERPALPPAAAQPTVAATTAMPARPRNYKQTGACLFRCSSGRKEGRSPCKFIHAPLRARRREGWHGDLRSTAENSLRALTSRNLPCRNLPSRTHARTRSTRLKTHIIQYARTGCETCA